MDLDHERRLAQVESRAKANSHRIEKLEESTEAIHKLASCMEVLAARQQQVANTVDKLDGKVTALEAKPGKRWEALAEKTLLVLAGAFVTWLAAGAPGLGG